MVSQRSRLLGKEIRPAKWQRLPVMGACSGPSCLSWIADSNLFRRLNFHQSRMSQEQLDKLQREAWELEASPAKVAILEQAVQLADSLGDLDESFSIRQDLIEAATFGGM